MLDFEVWLGQHNTSTSNKLSANQAHFVVWDGFDDPKRFASLLAYVFRDANGRLVVLLQSKLTPMHDPMFKFENSGLSRGKAVYIFDAGKSDSRAFCSMVCADALNPQLYQDIADKLHGRELLVFHPQLNKSPYFAGIMDYVNNYICKGWVFLRLNWAQGTKLSSSVIEEAGTGVIYNSDNSVKGWWSNTDNHPNYLQNRSCGLHLLMQKNRWRTHWLFPPEPHASLYHLRQPGLQVHPGQMFHMLTAEKTYSYDNNKPGWQQRSCCPWNDFHSKLTVKEHEIQCFVNRINCANCGGSKQCALFMVDRFISLIHGMDDHDVIVESPQDSHGNGCITNLAGNRLREAQESISTAEMISAYLQNLPQSADALENDDIKSLNMIYPDGVRIEVHDEQQQNSLGMYNVAGSDTASGVANWCTRKGWAVYTDTIDLCELALTHEKNNRRTRVEVGCMLFYKNQAQPDTVKLYPNKRWQLLTDVRPNAQITNESDTGIGGQ